MTTTQIEVRGLEEAQAKAEQVALDLRGPPFVQAMRDATLIVSATAKRTGYAPVDTGRLRASITPEVRQHGPTVQGVVGSNVVYAPYMELGTRPHFPPLQALEPWARRHGMKAWHVALSIARKGTKARRYLRRALEDNAAKIFNKIGRAVNKIVVK